ncbi:MAG TPA: hypothetical protein PLU24_02365, partial [Candidatus Omnitrophota bacterium]|nr:hypothetical protein [Candidatus Omnitrophota bacterium]
PYAKNAPDIVIGFNTGYRSSWKSAIGGAGVNILEDNKKKWSGDHLFDPELVPGVFFSNSLPAKEPSSLQDVYNFILDLIKE